MSSTGHLGFLQRRSALRGSIYIPRYYDIEITERLNELAATHELVVLGDLMDRGELIASTGHEIGKMAYGTGAIPFVRTSDITNWEVKTDPKQGVSQEIYEQYARRQDVRAGDLFFVRDGTYLIGSACLVTPADANLLYQSHIVKFRVTPEAPITAPLLLALLSAPIVRRQIKAKQFTADIIDTIGHRYRELVLPIPKDLTERARVSGDVQAIVEQRTALRERLRRIPLWAEGTIAELDEPVPIKADEAFELGGNVGFLTPLRDVRKGIFVPRYYSPELEQDLRSLSATHEQVSLGELVEQEVLAFDTGIEVGKMAYGTGTLPFIRTSDISNWELKGDPKQNVSAEQYEAARRKLDVRPGDIFVVRDGTYLVGASAIVTQHDPGMLYAGGLYKIRTKQPQILDPYLLLALLNTPIVRRQMRAKQFTRDIIDTLGLRIFEITIPIPKDRQARDQVAAVTRETIETRALLREQARLLVLGIEGVQQVEEEESELVGLL